MFSCRPKDYIVYGNGNIYLLEPNKFGFQDNEAPSIGKDKYTGIGLSKGVKILEGNNKPGGKDYMPALVLDGKRMRSWIAICYLLFSQEDGLPL